LDEDFCPLPVITPTELATVPGAPRRLAIGPSARFAGLGALAGLASEVAREHPSYLGHRPLIRVGDDTGRGDDSEAVAVRGLEELHAELHVSAQPLLIEGEDGADRSALSFGE
jgi:hypothetical protein